jgi:hypothetical protein
MVMLIPARSDGGIEIRLAGIAEAAWTVAAP